jgi:hypothetical protein
MTGDHLLPPMHLQASVKAERRPCNENTFFSPTLGVETHVQPRPVIGHNSARGFCLEWTRRVMKASGARKGNANPLRTAEQRPCLVAFRGTQIEEHRFRNISWR